MVKEFNSLKDIQKYYNKETDTYVFEEDGEPIRLVKFNFDFIVRSNIEACNINAGNIIAHNINAADITARNIKAHNINAIDIKADDISYYAVCFAYNSIKCKSIEGRRHNSKHFVLDGKLEVEEDE